MYNDEEIMKTFPEGSRVCHSIRASIHEVIAKAPDNAIFVESGGYLGFTSKYIVELLLASKKSFTYYVIDDWTFSNVGDKYLNNLDVYKQNLGEHLKHVNIIESDSLKAVELFKDDSVYYCFIDDNHTYGHVVKQIGLWLPKMQDYSIMSGDDYYSDDVFNAVAEWFEKKDIIGLNGQDGFLVENPKEKAKKRD